MSELNQATRRGVRQKARLASRVRLPARSTFDDRAAQFAPDSAGPEGDEISEPIDKH
ncbi:MAG TPA: hypothetical protein VGE52_18320 [Pirellulales bacterium]